MMELLPYILGVASATSVFVTPIIVSSFKSRGKRDELANRKKVKELFTRTLNETANNFFAELESKEKFIRENQPSSSSREIELFDKNDEFSKQKEKLMKFHVRNIESLDYLIVESSGSFEDMVKKTMELNKSFRLESEELMKPVIELEEGAKKNADYRQSFKELEKTVGHYQKNFIDLSKECRIMLEPVTKHYSAYDTEYANLLPVKIRKLSRFFENTHYLEQGRLIFNEYDKQKAYRDVQTFIRRVKKLKEMNEDTAKYLLELDSFDRQVNAFMDAFRIDMKEAKKISLSRKTDMKLEQFIEDVVNLIYGIEIKSFRSGNPRKEFQKMIQPIIESYEHSTGIPPHNYMNVYEAYELLEV